MKESCFNQDGKPVSFNNKGEVYGAKTILSETAKGGPALVNINDTVLAVAWTGTDSAQSLNVASSPSRA